MLSKASPAPFSLQGKVVIQFGGTGLLGRALVSAIGSAGATLVVASRDRSALETLATAERANGCDTHIDEVDLAAEASIRALRDRTVATHGRIDGVVFNAVHRAMNGFGADLATWKASMDINATGFFSAIRLIGDTMAERGSGSIVNIASQMGTVGLNPALYDSPAAFPSPDYFFHKGGMINLTRYLASYYGGRGVRANVVSPGGIYNPERPQAPEFLKRYAPMTMLGRMADAPEIGGATVFLLSDASSYITGINLPVDGGYTAK